MKRFICFLVIVICISSNYSIAMAAEIRDSVFEIESTYETYEKLVCPYEDKSWGYMDTVYTIHHGTTFMINGNLFVTSAHTLRLSTGAFATEATVKFNYYDKNNVLKETEQVLKVAYLNEDNDIAILYGNKKTAKYGKPLSIDFGWSLESNTRIITYRYDKQDAIECLYQGIGDVFYTQTYPVCETNTVLEFEAVRNETIDFTGNVYKGNSGGPLIYNEKVIGVVFASSEEDAHAINLLKIKDDLYKLGYFD